jgi:hypothetical protein
MVIAVRTVFVGVFKLASVFPEALLAFLTGEDHLELLQQLMVFALVVAFGAVEPLLACSW